MKLKFVNTFLEVIEFKESIGNGHISIKSIIELI